MKQPPFMVHAALCMQVLLFLLTTTTLNAQNDSSAAGKLTITGKVTDEKGTPLPGVTVQVKGTQARTSVKEDGAFSISVPSTTAVLVFSYVGYVQQEVPLDNKTTLTVFLVSSQKQLEDVVVIGYGTQKKRNVTGAVAIFDASKLDERPVTRVDQALVGQMAGVQVKQTTGALGKGLSVRVRGSGSITAGNEPLYVIDGFPLATAAANGSGNYALGNPLDNINPNDIENIQVLKDASAAAIYGSRAANGVVIITTKRGQSGKPKISLNSYVGYSERSRKLDMLSAEEWIDRATDMINTQWIASGPGRTATQTNEERRLLLGLAPGEVNINLMTDNRWTQAGHPGLRYIDWQDETFRKGLMQNHQLSASGGNESVRYYISGNYARQEGMVINTDYTSYSARANVEVNASKKLKFGLNLTPTYSITNDPGVEGKDNILHQLLSYSPVQEDTLGLYPNIGNNGQYKWSTTANSPVGKLQNIIGQTKRFRTLTSLFAEYQVIKGLTLRTTLNLDNTDVNAKSYTPYIVTSTRDTRIQKTTELTSGSVAGYRKQTFVNENTLTYNKTIGESHDVSLLAGLSYNSDKIDNFRVASNNGYTFNSITTLNTAVAVTGNTTEAKNVLLSWFGRAQYSFDSKYLFSASLRRDGSSRFGENTKWGWFPSASIGWRVSEESFLKNVSFISDLKLRASWGRSGNYNIGDYSTIPTLANYNYSFNSTQVTGVAPAGITNPDLTWEKSETFDAGFDVSVLNNRISVSFDYYNKLNTALLINMPVFAITGFNTILSNAGKARNTGWEVEVSSRNTIKAFQWTTSVNLSYNTNKVVALAGGQNQILIPTAYANADHSILRVGDPMYSIYVVKQIGILSQEDIDKGVPLFGNQKAGDPKYFDKDDSKSIDANDRMVVGHPNPDYTWGITNTFRYKGFDLMVLLQGQWGGSIYSLLGRALGRTGQGIVDNAYGFYRDRWRSAENPGAGKVGKAYSNFGVIPNTDWLWSSDYMRVRNITLGYNLGGLMKTKSIQAARLYITAENFFGHDKYKGGLNPEATNTDVSGNTNFPEAGDYGGLPLPRSLIIGLNITF